MLDTYSTIRTQISLTPTIKKAIEAKKRLTGESLSAYLRKAAWMRISAEEEEKKELKVLAQNFIGAGRWDKNHPCWRSQKAVNRWLKALRDEWV